MPKPKFGAFNQGDIPKIAVFNKATIPLGVDLDQLIAATNSTQGLRLAPVIDGWSLLRDPFSPDAPPMSADVPVLLGTVETEVGTPVIKLVRAST